MKQKETMLDKLGKAINLAGNAIMMNLLFLVSCIPIVTIGQAWCGLLTAVRYNIRGEKWFDGYKTGFARRFWRGTIAWCGMLLINVHMLLDINHNLVQGYTSVLIVSSLIFAMTAMFTTALLILNVYIPTKIIDWLKNAADMVFKAPLVLLGAAALLWLPVLLCLFWFEMFYYCALIFLAVYFSVAGLAMTMVMKDTLIIYLVTARAHGTLIAEEGKQANADEDEEAEEE